MTKTPKQIVLETLSRFLIGMRGRWPLLIYLGLFLFAWQLDRRDENHTREIQAEQDRQRNADDAERIQALLQRAEQGDADAQVELGVEYASFGRNKPDYAEAVKWFRMAAEKGHLGAQSTLGLIAFEMEDAEMMRQVFEAAENGDAIAQNTLGLVYTGSSSMEENTTEAQKWFRKAAEQGNRASKYNLGDLCRSEKDYAQAAMWFREAAEDGDSGAQYMLGILYLRGDGVEKNTIEAVKWIHKAAEQGDPDATEYLEQLGKQPNEWER